MNRTHRRATIGRLTVVVGALLLGACAASANARRNSSVLDFLYDGASPSADSLRVAPTLRLPLRVGIAFVPEGSDDGTSRRRHVHRDDESVLTEQDKLALMNRVAERFRDRAYVSTIELIPTDYLRPRGGFENLEQLRQMFGVDVVALISYDQVQFTDERKRSLLYLTIAGAYLVDGAKNDTRTMLDAAVFDVTSRRLLFRAPGQSHVEGSASPADARLHRRKDGRTGLQLASDDLAVNLDSAVAQFSARLREPRSDVRVIRPDSAR